MSQPYVGEIRQFAGNFAPVGWSMCNGSIVNISDNSTLFTLIGTTYGGDGVQTFGLPNLQGRIPIHMGSFNGNNYVIGQLGGAENVTLNLPQLAAHSHNVAVSGTNSATDKPAGNYFSAANTGSNVYTAAPGTLALNTTSVTTIGGNQSHDNMVPYVAVNYIISLYGIFPPRP
jgi:microcystin-dependent protein